MLPFGVYKEVTKHYRGLQKRQAVPLVLPNFVSNFAPFMHSLFRLLGFAGVKVDRSSVKDQLVLSGNDIDQVSRSAALISQV